MNVQIWDPFKENWDIFKGEMEQIPREGDFVIVEDVKYKVEKVYWNVTTKLTKIRVSFD